MYLKYLKTCYINRRFLFVIAGLSNIIYNVGDVNMAGQQYKRIHRYSRRLPRPPWIASLTLVLLFVNLACSSITCGSGIKTPGGKNK